MRVIVSNFIFYGLFGLLMSVIPVGLYYTYQYGPWYLIPLTFTLVGLTGITVEKVP